MIKYIATLLCAWLPLAALAENSFDLSQLQSGETLLNVSAKESKKVEQDLIIALLTISTEGLDATMIQDQINKAMKQALQLAGRYSQVEHETERYHVGKPYESNVWKARQSIRLTSKWEDKILELVAKLQSNGFNMESLNYTLSTERYDEVSDSLLEGALKKLQSKANNVAKMIGKSSAQLIEVTSDVNQRHFNVRSAAMASYSSEIATPNISPGKSEVSLTVSAKALLKP